jgi:SOUL heme-binding protein
MRSAFNLIVIGCTLALANAQYKWPEQSPAVGTSFRVQGESPAAVLVDGKWTSGNLKQESPLPDGYVAPTPADNIELKTYPTVRRAEFDSEHLWLKNVWGINRAFSKLFNHI